MAGLYLRHPFSLEHDTGAHPESADRIRAIEALLEAERWHGLELVEAPPASREQLLRVHPEPHIAAIESLSLGGGGMIDADTVVSVQSYEAALRAAGAATHAVDRLLDDPAIGFSFCGLRPPGHHAERDRAMGFCLFNNIAIGVAHGLARGVKRAMVVDWDVHHGNGTQEIFYEAPEVLFASIHQSPLYPGTGSPAERGSGAGEGLTVNLPVEPGAGPDEFLSIVQTVIAPLARDFDPGLIAVSAGFDAHRADPLGDCMLDEAAYADLAASIRDVAAELEVPVLICLEGGYALAALAASVNATLAALSGSAPPRAAPPQAAVSQRSRLRERWPALA